MSRVYVVTVDYEYETRDPIRAFESEESANNFVRECVEYTQTRKPCPPIESDSPENDALWDKWGRWNKRWSAKHPAGRDHASNGNSLSITEVELSP